MCTGGVNFTQFKLALHQLAKFEDTVSSSLKQWQELIGQLGFTDLAGILGETARKSAATLSDMNTAMAAIDRLSAAGEDTVTITPL